MKKENKRWNDTGMTVGLGIMIGTVIGILLDNLGLWISMGIIFGAAAQQYPHAKKKNSEN